MNAPKRKLLKPPNNTTQYTMNFNQDPFTGTNGDCSKFNWATKCGVTWDGVTYGVQNPCSTTTTEDDTTT